MDEAAAVRTATLEIGQDKSSELSMNIVLKGFHRSQLGGILRPFHSMEACLKSNDETVCHDGILAIGEVESSELVDDKLYHILGQRFSSIRY